VAGEGLFTFLKDMRGRGWSKFVLELGKVRDFLNITDGHGMVRLASVLERLRRAGDVDNEDFVPFVPVGSPGKNGVILRGSPA
jgi:hypothetical protein